MSSKQTSRLRALRAATRQASPTWTTTPDRERQTEPQPEQENDTSRLRRRDRHQLCEHGLGLAKHTHQRMAGAQPRRSDRALASAPSDGIRTVVSLERWAEA
jgi:hypothetical protein